MLHLPGGCGGGRAVRRSKRSEDIHIIIELHYIVKLLVCLPRMAQNYTLFLNL